MKLTAFNMCLMIVLAFGALAILAYINNITEIIGFFSICSIVFLMLLPSCSREV